MRCMSATKASKQLSGMLDISGHLAQARAIDELFGLRKVDEYVAFIARNQRPKLAGRTGPPPRQTPR